MQNIFAMYKRYWQFYSFTKNFLRKIWTSLPITEAVNIATKFALALFKNQNESIKTLNKSRYQLTTTTNKSASELPPTDDAFYQHVLRCIFQLRIWLSSHIHIMPLLDPINFAWARNNRILELILMAADGN